MHRAKSLGHFTMVVVLLAASVACWVSLARAECNNRTTRAVFCPRPAALPEESSNACSFWNIEEGDNEDIINFKVGQCMQYQIEVQNPNQDDWDTQPQAFYYAFVDYELPPVVCSVEYHCVWDLLLDECVKNQQTALNQYEGRYSSYPCAEGSF